MLKAGVSRWRTRRVCPQCGREKPEALFWWNAKRCRSCVAQAVGERRAVKTARWKQEIRTRYNVAIGVSRPRYLQFLAVATERAESVTPKTRKHYVAAGFRIGAVLAMVSAVGACSVGVVRQDGSFLWAAALLFGLFAVVSGLSERLEVERKRKVREHTELFLREHLKDYEAEQLEYQRFYHTDEWRRLRALVIARDGSRCASCRRPIRREEDLTVDHVKPRSRYPELALNPDNLQVLCRRCNSAKGNSIFG